MPATTAPAATLTGSDRRVLETLGTVAGEISNPDLRDRYGWTLVGEQRRKLNTAGLVTSRKVGRCFVHRLVAHSQPESVEDQIRAAYSELSPEPGAWIGLARIRPLLNAPRADVDAALFKLSISGSCFVTPEANQKALTQADRDAAVRIGGKDKHLIAIPGGAR